MKEHSNQLLCLKEILTNTFCSIIHWYLKQKKKKKILKKIMKLSRSFFKTGQNVIIFFSCDGEDKRDGVEKQPSLPPCPHPDQFWTKLAVVS